MCVHYLHSCNTEPRRAFVLCSRCSRFFIKKPSSLLPYLLPVPCVPCVPDLRPFLCPFGRFLHSCVPFAVPFALKRLQRSFHTVFRAILSGLFVHAYICTICVVSCVCIALFCPILPFCVGWGWDYPLNPSGARRN